MSTANTARARARSLSLFLPLSQMLDRSDHGASLTSAPLPTGMSTIDSYLRPCPCRDRHVLGVEDEDSPVEGSVIPPRFVNVTFLVDVKIVAILVCDVQRRLPATVFSLTTHKITQPAARA